PPLRQPSDCPSVEPAWGPGLPPLEGDGGGRKTTWRGTSQGSCWRAWPVVVEGTFLRARSPEDREQRRDGPGKHTSGWIGFSGGQPPDKRGTAPSETVARLRRMCGKAF